MFYAYPEKQQCCNHKGKYWLAHQANPALYKTLLFLRKAQGCPTWDLPRFSCGLARELLLLWFE